MFATYRDDVPDKSILSGTVHGDRRTSTRVGSPRPSNALFAHELILAESAFVFFGARDERRGGALLPGAFPTFQHSYPFAGRAA